MNELTYSTIRELPTIEVCDLYQLALTVDFTALQYGKAADRARRAWEMFSDAIDSQDPDLDLYRENAINAERDKRAAGRTWQDAKRTLLAVQS